MNRESAQSLCAFGLSAGLLLFGAWLIFKALAEIGGVVIPGKNEVVL